MLCIVTDTVQRVKRWDCHVVHLMSALLDHTQRSLLYLQSFKASCQCLYSLKRCYSYQLSNFSCLGCNRGMKLFACVGWYKFVHAKCVENWVKTLSRADTYTFTVMSRLTLGSTQHLSPVLKWLEQKPALTTMYCSGWEYVEYYLHCPYVHMTCLVKQCCDQFWALYVQIICLFTLENKNFLFCHAKSCSSHWLFGEVLCCFPQSLHANARIVPW